MLRSLGGGDAAGERVTGCFPRPALLRDLDLLELSERFRFFASAREPMESAEGERLRRRSLTGLTDREVLRDFARRRRRRGGVRDGDLDSLIAGELDLS